MSKSNIQIVRNLPVKHNVNIADSKFYKEVDKAAKLTFGEGSRAYENTMNYIYVNEGKGSNFWFVAFAQDKVLGKSGQIYLVDDQGQILRQNPNFLSGIYTDHPQLVIRSYNDSFEDN